VDEYLAETLAPLLDRIQRVAPVAGAAEVNV
jgi:hypothetical protein